MLSKKKNASQEVGQATTFYPKAEGWAGSVSETSSGLPDSQSPVSYLRGSGEPDSPQTGAYHLEALRRGILHGDLPRVPHGNSRKRKVGSSKWLYLACLTGLLIACPIGANPSPADKSITPPLPKKLVRLTAYWKGQDYYTSKGQSSSGARLVSGKSCAVDPRLFPYGTTILIKGREFKAVDTGTAVVNRKSEWAKPAGKRLPVVDLFFKSEKEAERMLDSLPKYVEVEYRKQ